MKVLTELFEKRMVLTTEQGNLLKPEKVIRFFNDLCHNPFELDQIVTEILESQAPQCVLTDQEASLEYCTCMYVHKKFSVLVCLLQ